MSVSSVIKSLANGKNNVFAKVNANKGAYFKKLSNVMLNNNPIPTFNNTPKGVPNQTVNAIAAKNNLADQYSENTHANTSLRTDELKLNKPNAFVNTTRQKIIKNENSYIPPTTGVGIAPRINYTKTNVTSSVAENYKHKSTESIPSKLIPNDVKTLTGSGFIGTKETLSRIANNITNNSSVNNITKNDNSNSSALTKTSTLNNNITKNDNSNSNSSALTKTSTLNNNITKNDNSNSSTLDAFNRISQVTQNLDNNRPKGSAPTVAKDNTPDLSSISTPINELVSETKEYSGKFKLLNDEQKKQTKLLEKISISLDKGGSGGLIEAAADMFDKKRGKGLGRRVASKLGNIAKRAVPFIKKNLGGISKVARTALGSAGQIARTAATSGLATNTTMATGRLLARATPVGMAIATGATIGDTIGSAIYKKYENTDFMKGVGEKVAKVAAFFGNDEAKQAVSINEAPIPVDKNNKFDYVAAAKGFKADKKIIGMTENETKALASITMKTESGGNQKAKNTFGFSGQYQFGADALAGEGLVNRKKLDAAKKAAGKSWYSGGGHKAFLEDPSNWKIEGGQQAFLSDKKLQDKAFVDYTNKNIQAGLKSGALKEGDSPEKFAAYAKAAHLKGAGGANELFLSNKDSKDAYGMAASVYAKDASDKLVGLAEQLNADDKQKTTKPGEGTVLAKTDSTKTTKPGEGTVLAKTDSTKTSTKPGEGTILAKTDSTKPTTLGEGTVLAKTNSTKTSTKPGEGTVLAKTNSTKPTTLGEGTVLAKTDSTKDTGISTEKNVATTKTSKAKATAAYSKTTKGSPLVLKEVVDSIDTNNRTTTTSLENSLMPKTPLSASSLSAANKPLSDDLITALTPKPQAPPTANIKPSNSVESLATAYVSSTGGSEMQAPPVQVSSNSKGQLPAPEASGGPKTSGNTAKGGSSKGTASSSGDAANKENAMMAVRNISSTIQRVFDKDFQLGV